MVKLVQFTGLIIGIIVAVTGYYYLFVDYLNWFYFLMVVAMIISVLPFLLSFFSILSVAKEKESKFLEFSRDLVEGVKSGTPINKAIVNLQAKDYGALTPHIMKLSNQINFGIALDTALNTFAKDTKNKVIARAVVLISEAQKAGGKIETIIESVARSVNQIEELKKERASSVYNLVIQGYIIFMVFIIIMLVLEYAILPLAADLSNSDFDALGVDGGAAISTDQFGAPLFVMLLVQSLFAGLVIGKVSDGSIFSGVRHSFFLLTITLLVVTGVRAFLG
ncbi:MAG: flagellar protein FlaJ [Patescibacteria group bacterium]|jgi:flagellar protein FlaJ